MPHCGVTMTEKPWKLHEVAIFAAIGFAVGWTPAFAIIHELGHALIAALSSGMELGRIRWASIGWTGEPSALFFAAGYASVVTFDFTVAGVAIRRWSFGAAPFWLGHGLAQIPFAALSEDHYQLAEAFGANAATLRWAAFAALCLPVALGLTSSLMRQRKRARHRYELDRARRYLRRMNRKWGYLDEKWGRSGPDTLRQPA